MIEIFKTNVKHSVAARRIIHELLDKYPRFTISFDLGDEDKILRVEGNFFHVEDIIFSLLNNNFICIHLPYDLDSWVV
ncbi:hypothetical protein [Pedobacter cryoconitis]|uniref:Uncharacterized protein n=1 Tax=Pedobacter cryoconitis TaxID=188932 RepID=A0A7X0MIF3_9SPHI|nr:hypothetical protein [Pedobacter cryoconitis]MBB6499861.1 hypothetical protein [Pedobacter cryoconitis]